MGGGLIFTKHQNGLVRKSNVPFGTCRIKQLDDDAVINADYKIPPGEVYIVSSRINGKITYNEILRRAGDTIVYFMQEDHQMFVYVTLSDTRPAIPVQTIANQ